MQSSLPSSREQPGQHSPSRVPGCRRAPPGCGGCLKDNNCTRGPASGLFKHPELEPPWLGAGKAKKPVKAPGRLVQKPILHRRFAASRPWWAGAGTAPSTRLLRGHSTARSCSAPIRTPQHHLPVPRHRMGPRFLWGHRPAAQPSRLAGCCPGCSICKQVKTGLIFFPFKPLPVL